MLSLLLSKFGGWIAGAGALLLGLLALVGISRKAGKTAAEDQQIKQALTDAKDANAIDDSVHRLSDDELNKRLSEFTRKE